MRIRIEKSRAEGKITPPSSKSMAHRLLICAAMAEGESVIENVTFSDDILATLDCLEKMGAKCDIDGSTVHLSGVPAFDFPFGGKFNCRESGSTLRFLLPLILLSGEKQVIRGEKRLFERPLGVYEEICKKNGLLFEKGEFLSVRGRLESGDYSVPGNVSSQFISGLIFALLMSDGTSRINIIPPFESASYVNMTLYAVSLFGADFEIGDDLTIVIHGGKRLEPKSLSVESDYSAAAFLDAFNLLGGKVEVIGLNDESLQGDKIYKKYFRLLDYGSPNLDIADCPDLAPILMTLAAAKHGCRLLNTKRLKLKESDRGAVMAAELSKFGAEIEVKENEIVVHKSRLHTPDKTLSGNNDHRVVMSLAVLCSAFGGTIDGAEAVAKSYPDFFEDIRTLGIEVFEDVDQ